jgi:hypothetical protein
VRVNVALTPQQNAALRENDVREALDSAHFVAAVVKSLEQDRRRRAFDTASPESMEPMEALRRYFESVEKPPDYREQLHARARAIVESEGGAPVTDQQ